MLFTLTNRSTSWSFDRLGALARCPVPSSECWFCERLLAGICGNSSLTSLPCTADTVTLAARLGAAAAVDALVRLGALGTGLLFALLAMRGEGAATGFDTTAGLLVRLLLRITATGGPCSAPEAIGRVGALERGVDELLLALAVEPEFARTFLGVKPAPFFCSSALSGVSTTRAFGVGLGTSRLLLPVAAPAGPTLPLEEDRVCTGGRAPEEVSVLFTATDVMRGTTAGEADLAGAAEAADCAEVTGTFTTVFAGTSGACAVGLGALPEGGTARNSRAPCS